MIKKRLLSFLGAAAITAALTFTVVSLSPSNGFTSGTMQEGLCYASGVVYISAAPFRLAPHALKGQKLLAQGNTLGINEI